MQPRRAGAIAPGKEKAAKAAAFLEAPAIAGWWMVEPIGIEPTTSSMPLKRSPN
jgi:hypothetical protein